MRQLPLILLFVMVSWLPALAQQEEPRLVVTLEGWSSTVRGNERDFAFVGAGGLSGGGEVQVLSFDREISPRFGFGWRIGDGDTILGVSLWEQNADAAAATGQTDADVGALLASPDFAIGRSLVDSAEARGQIRSTVVDLTASWGAWNGGDAEMQATVGLRLFRYEETVSVVYRLDSFGVRLDEFINESSDTDGIGPRVALRFGRRLGKVRLVGAIGMAAVVGDQVSSRNDTVLVGGSFDRATAVERPAVRSALLHFDGLIGAEGRIGPVTLEGGYRFEAWQGISRTQRFVDDVSQNTTVERRDDLVAEGIYLGARFRF